MITTDVTKKEDVDKIVKQAMKRFNQIDLMINDAGITLPGRV